jgi:MFS family permease
MVDSWGASVSFTLVLAVGVLGQWLGGRASDAIGPKKVLIATMGGVCLGLISLLLVPIYVVGIALFILLYGLSFYAHQPALNYLTGLLSPRNQRGAVYGVFFFTSFGIGSLSQVMAGYIADAYGLDTSFALLATFALVALILSFGLPDKQENGQTSVTKSAPYTEAPTEAHHTPLQRRTERTESPRTLYIPQQIPETLTNRPPHSNKWQRDYQGDLSR